MKSIPFWKMSGSGNDFVMIDNRRGTFPKQVSAWAKRLCHRQEGVGADGLLLLEKSRKADFRMVYFNADGSRASMCGNGARCMAWFAHENSVPRATRSNLKPTPDSCERPFTIMSKSPSAKRVTIAPEMLAAGGKNLSGSFSQYRRAACRRLCPARG